MLNLAKKGVLLFSIFGLFAAFQNCSHVNFTPEGMLDESEQNDGQAVPTPVIACTFNGREYQEGQEVEAFRSSTVPAGASCVSEIRKCQAGSFSGSFAFASCAVGEPQSCLFDGKTIAHGQNVEAYLNSSVDFGTSCRSEIRSCDNGILTGSYNYSKCSVGEAASCLFNGQTIAHGASVKAFSAGSVAFGQSCASESRTCNNGSLSGTYAHASCEVGKAASCLFNGTTVAHGQAVTAFASSSVASGKTCTSEARVCQNGALSGSYSFASCTIDKPASCLFNGSTIAHGQSVVAYATSSGATCNSQARLCANGVLSGSYSFASCKVTNPCPSGQVYRGGRCVSSLSGQSCTFYGAAGPADEVFKNRHCHLDGGGAWAGQRFCEYNSRGCGKGTCQCYTDGTYDDSGVCRMAAHRKSAWQNNGYIALFGQAHLLPSAQPAARPTTNACR